MVKFALGMAAGWFGAFLLLAYDADFAQEIADDSMKARRRHQLDMTATEAKIRLKNWSNRVPQEV